MPLLGSDVASARLPVRSVNPTATPPMSSPQAVRVVTAPSSMPRPSLAQDGEPDLDAPEMESVYDPYRGIDPDGRIPRIDKAALVDRPERWRYIPEGRIKPGNLFQRFLVSSFIVPLFFASSDVGIGGGAAVTDIDFRAQRGRRYLMLSVGGCSSSSVPPSWNSGQRGKI